MEEMPIVHTGLERVNQAKQVALEARDRHVHHSKRLSSSPSGTGVVKVVDEPLAASEEHYVNTEEADDKLPEGLSFKDLPKFKRIHGWDKDNRQLK